MAEQIHAVISNGLVDNVVVGDQTFMDQWYPGSVDITGMDPMPGIGWSYDGANFTAPNPPAPPPPPTVFTTQAFRARYTLDELIACDNAPANTSLAQADADHMNTINTSIVAADTIDITNQNVIDAVNFEASIGLITAARASEILDPTSAPPSGAFRF